MTNQRFGIGLISCGTIGSVLARTIDRKTVGEIQLIASASATLSALATLKKLTQQTQVGT